ncbi:MAG: T9SS type A sorting domain-containing protein, partial [candidate division KSB1 bacterium]|nr:T9SS type A sorting domain-containing protein [candidate division KSB1 bacterium]
VMKPKIFVARFSLLLLLAALPVLAQPTNRPDVVWARSTAGAALTLDGKLDEAAWSKAQTVSVKYPQSTAIIPGSGWKDEGGVTTSDPTDATIKFLVQDNWLWLGITCKDKSIGGKLFNQFDGFLMNIRDHSKASRPAPHFEVFYAWLAEPWADPTTGLVGASPGYFGSEGGPRDAVKSQIWNAATTVVGLTNSDSILDESYTSEIAINLTPRGYDVTRAAGDIVELNISIYDADWQWPFDAAKFSSNRTWLQGPWGNANWFNVLRIHARPDVTINSTTLPAIGPEVVIPNAGNNPAPAIDGRLEEGIWQKVPGLDLRYGDGALRDSYSSVGPYRSGEFQPEINGIRAAVLDPADATIKWFFKGDMLYLGVDVRDQAVWGNRNFDQWDGIRFIINDRSALDSDNHVLLRRNLEVHIDSSGALLATGDLVNLLATGGAQVAYALKPNTTLNNFNDVDEGYWIEMALDLTKFGYPTGLGDGVLFLSATLFDGDNFANPADNYGNRVWWMREREIDAAPAWALMDKGTVVSVADRGTGGVPDVFTLYGNYPNPFNPTTTISYGMPADGLVTLRVYDLLGRSVMVRPLGLQSAGRHEILVDAGKLKSGIYFYRLEMTARGSNQTARTLYGRMMLLK